MHSYTDFPPPWSALWDFQQPKDTQQRLLDHLSETAADSTVAYQIEVQTQVVRNPPRREGKTTLRLPSA